MTAGQLTKRYVLLALMVIAVGVSSVSAAAATSNRSAYAAARAAVCHYFGANCGMAMQIVNCETGGTYTPWASNGQYLGMFQMGSAARKQYGHGSNVWAQAKAAFALFRDRGFEPWLCCEPPGCGA